MSFANFGIGVGAFADGLTRGMGLGREIKQARNERQIDTIRKEGLSQAREAAGPEASPDAIMQNFMQTGVPRIAEAYLQQGNVEKAEAWTQWAQNREQQRGMKDWANAYQAAQTGNYDVVANYVAENARRLDPSIQLRSWRKGTESGKDGFFVTVGREEGTDQDIFIDNETLVRKGLSMLSPPEQFNLRWQEMQGAQQARAKATSEDLKHERGVFMEQMKQEHRVELESLKEQLRSARDRNEFDAKVESAAATLSRYGYNSDEISAMVPRIMGIANVRQEIGETDLRLRATEILSRNNMRFSRMKPEEQAQMIDEMVGVIRAQSGGGQSSGGQRAQQQRVEAQGMPPSEGLIILDQTGRENRFNPYQ